MLVHCGAPSRKIPAATCDNLLGNIAADYELIGVAQTYRMAKALTLEAYEDEKADLKQCRRCRWWSVYGVSVDDGRRFDKLGAKVHYPTEG